MKKLLIAFAVLAIAFTSCKKEGSYEDPSRTPGGSTSTRLARLVTKESGDSLVNDFTYNAAGSISQIANYGVVSGTPVQIQQIINRDANNVITSMVLKSPLFLVLGFDTDSIETIYTYDPTKSQYVRGVSHSLQNGEALSDSLVFIYDGAGRLMTGISYHDDGTGYAVDSKAEYTYAGNNLASEKDYDVNGSTFELAETVTYEYDTKVNPMQFAADAPVLGMGDYYSANNKTKATHVVVDPAETSVVSVTYTYNSDDRPTLATGSSGGSASTVNYYYQ